MADLELTVSAKQRKAMKPSAFGDPKDRCYPLIDAAHVRNAAARLEQQKGSMSVEKYHSIRNRIARAARKFGIDSEYNKKPATKAAPRAPSRGLRMTTTHPDGTKTEIHHMSAAYLDDADGGALRLSVPLNKSEALASGDDDRRWIQIGRAGRWLGHKQGPFELNAKVFEQICTNFETQKVGRIQYDFEHASEMNPASGDIPAIGTPAQGWIYALKHDGQRLFGLTEWKGLARAYIENDQYQGVSPAIRWNQKDRETGKPIGAVLSSVALTNQPFLVQMAPLAASAADVAAAVLCSLTEDTSSSQLAASSCCYSADEYIPRIKSALKLHELSTPTDMSDAMDKLREHMGAVGGDHTKSLNGVNLSDFALPLRGIVNAHAGMSWDEVFDVVDDLIDAAMDKHIIQDHGGVEETSDATLNSSAEAIDLAASNPSKGATTMAAKTVEQLELELTALMTERNQLKADLEAISAVNAQLSAKVEEHEAHALSARVDVAYETYKEKKGLDPNQKKGMLTLLRADAAAFEEMFPNMPAPQRHLLTNFTSDGRNSMSVVKTSPTNNRRVPADSPSEGPDVTTMSARELTSHIMRTEKLSLAAAQNKALAIIKRVQNAQRAR